MKFSKKLLVFIFDFALTLTSIPNYTSAIVTYADLGPVTVEGSNGEYVMVFVQDTISNEVSVEQNIKSRTMRRLPTEFQIEEINDTEILSETFEFNGTEYYTNQTDVAYLNGFCYLFIAAEDLTTNNVTFLALKSDNNGVSWSEPTLILNTSIIYGEDSYFCFDLVTKGSELVLGYGYGFEQILGNETYYLTSADVLEIDPDTLNVTDSFFIGSGFGKDFEFYNYNDDILVIYTEESGLVHTVEFEELDDTYSTVATIGSFEPPYDVLSIMKPTVTYWLGQFYMIAQDNLTDVIDVGQDIVKSETFLWGKSFEVTQGLFGLEAIAGTIQDHVIIKDQDNFDGYYRREPSLSVYEDRLFLTFIVGRGDRFGGKGWPGVAFAFSADGDTWTSNFLGDYSFFMNLGTYFIIGTVGLFAIVYPSYLVYTKRIKGKK